MTEIATRDEQHSTAVATPPVSELAAGTTNLMAWVQQADAAYQIAERLSSTSFVPASLRGKPAETAAAILAGAELGLGVMATLKSIDIIQGTPALRAHAMRGLVQAQGHDVELVESTDTYCKMRGRRKGSRAYQVVEWTIDRASKMGLLGKDQWKKNPKGMLVARATGDMCRLIASDALHGMPYAAEELEGTVHAEVMPVQAPLDINALTGPSTQIVPPAGDLGYTVTRDDEPDQDAPNEKGTDVSSNWPEVAQPGGGEWEE